MITDMHVDQFRRVADACMWHMHVADILHVGALHGALPGPPWALVEQSGVAVTAKSSAGWLQPSPPGRLQSPVCSAATPAQPLLLLPA